MLGELDVRRSTTRVTLHGELDLVTIDSLRRILADAVMDDPEHVVIDLSDVPFMDVLSLSTILAAADAQRDRGGTLIVAGAAAPVRRVCALLNADDVLAPDMPFPRASNS
jgi:anti-anti-sigma factor